MDIYPKNEEMNMIFPCTLSLTIRFAPSWQEKEDIITSTLYETMDLREPTALAPNKRRPFLSSSKFRHVQGRISATVHQHKEIMHLGIFHRAAPMQRPMQQQQIPIL